MPFFPIFYISFHELIWIALTDGLNKTEWLWWKFLIAMFCSVCLINLFYESFGLNCAALDRSWIWLYCRIELSRTLIGSHLFCLKDLFWIMKCATLWPKLIQFLTDLRSNWIDLNYLNFCECFARYEIEWNQMNHLFSWLPWSNWTVWIFADA